MDGYSTTASMLGKMSQKALIQLTDDDGLGTVNMDVFNRENSGVRSYIDGFLRGRYPLPLTTVDDIILQLSDNILRCRLIKRRNPNTANEQLDKDLRYYDSQLLLVQQGKTRLDVDLPAADQPGAGSFKTNKTAEDRVFTKDKLDTY